MTTINDGDLLRESNILWIAESDERGDYIRCISPSRFGEVFREFSRLDLQGFINGGSGGRWSKVE